MNVTAELNVQVDKPSSTIGVYIGQPQGLDDPANPNEISLWGATYEGRTWGTLWAGTVLTPPIYNDSGYDYGGWNYTQIVTPSRSRTFNGMSQNWSLNGLTGLDGTFGYAPYWPSLFDADGTEQVDGDAPEQGFAAGATFYSVSDSFVTYILYLPPGTDSKVIAVKDWDWYWHGWATWNSPVANVWNVNGDPGQWQFDQDFPLQPIWTVLITPSDSWN